MIIVKRCSIADKDHKASLRQYAHTFHHKDNVICITSEWITLSIDHQMGLIAHEVGHLLNGPIEHTEEEADRVANKFFNIHIKYKDSQYGKRLQYLSLNDTMNVWEWLEDNIKFEGRLFRS